MATCGTCQREVIWAWSEEDHAVIALDKLTATASGTTFSLDYVTETPHPVAVRVRRPDVHPGHRLHDETCGVGIIR